MLSYEEAIESIRAQTLPLRGSERVGIDQVVGRVLAEAIVAARPNPAFDNSAVDGYLLGRRSARRGDSFQVVGEIRAGSLPPFLAPHEAQAVRTFTGAPVPRGEFCIVMQEDAVAENGRITLTEDVKEHAGIRRTGTDFEAGTILAEPGARISAAEIAMASWSGSSEVAVRPRVRAAAVVTGDEIVEAGSEIKEGQIFDSNGPMLQSLIHGAAATEIVRARLPDSLEETKEALGRLSESKDVIVISGGASVGDYDHVPAAVAALGEVIFHKVSIKPGKPVLFGRIGNALVFGLPGNPASAYVCFQIFVREAIRRLAGESSAEPRWLPARFAGEHGPVNRDEFLRVSLCTKEGQLWAEPVFEQGSFGIRSLSGADALARLSLGRSYRHGDPVSIMILPE